MVPKILIPSETAITLVVLFYDNRNIIFCHGWPELVDEQQLAVRNAPEHEVTDTMFTRGTNHHVDRRNIWRVQACGDRFFIDVACTQPILDALAGGLNDLMLTTIVKTRTQYATGQMLCLLLCFGHSLSYFGRQRVFIAKMTKTNATINQLLKIRLYQTKRKLQQVTHLFFRTLPVLGRKRVD